MAITSRDPEQNPAVGDEFMVPVRSSPTRTTYFPDQVMVFPVSLPGAASVELILLRQELAIKSQKGLVREVEEGSISIEFTPDQMGYDMTDVAHVRLPVDQAINMAMTILSGVARDGSASLPELEARLRSLVEEGT